MKKKLTINTLALGNLKQRRKQYTIMIIGIILAMVFSSSALFFMKSANDTHKEQLANDYGYQDFIVSIDGYEQDDYKMLTKDSVADQYGLAHILGFVEIDKKTGKGYSIGWLDDNAEKISNQKLIEGVMPKKDNEVAIEESTLAIIGYKNAKLGDAIKLDIAVQNGNDYAETIEKEYKLVGILKDKYYNLSYDERSNEYSKIIPSIFVVKNSAVDLGGKENYCAYSISNKEFVKEYKKTLKDSRYTADYEAAYKHFEDLGLTFTANQMNFGGIDYFNFSAISDNGGYIFILVLVFIVASCVIISNAFNTNLKDRKKQIGMLRAIGTTKRQIVKIFGREAFIISLVAVPFSIIISYALVRIMLNLISKEAVINSNAWILLICAIVNVVIVMLSALIPLLFASKITPMQAIRNINNNHKIKTKKIKTKKQFVPSKHLAKRNLIFYKSSKTAVTFLLVITIVGTSLGASFVSNAKNDLRSFYYDYSIVEMNGGDANANTTNGMLENDKQSIEALSYVDAVYGKKAGTVYAGFNKLDSYIATLNSEMFIEPDDLNLENIKKNIKNCKLNKWEKEHMDETRDLYGIDGVPLSFGFYGFDERQIATLEEKLLDGKIDYDKLKSGEEIILVAPDRVQFRIKPYIKGSGYASYTLYDDEISNVSLNYKTVADERRTINAGDEIQISFNYVDYDDEGNAVLSAKSQVKTVKVGAIVSPNDCDSKYGFGIYDMAIITSLQGFNGFCPGKNYNAVGINVNCELDDDRNSDIADELEAYRAKYGGWLDNNYEYTKRQENDMRAYITTLLAITVLCFALCTSIINNSISAQIRENKRVIGTLRAVGADEKELVKSYFYQMISMLGLGVVIGYLLFVALFFVLKIICLMVGETFLLKFNPVLSLCMTVILAAVCTLNLWFRVHKEMKNSIVENIREL
ncbi:MAG: ABC transporter permease [Eubacterium sp.]